MKVIHYGSDELVTGDKIADALVRYAQFLAVAGQAATIDIPVLDPSNQVVTASVLLGPASQIVAFDSDRNAPEIVDEKLLADLTAQTNKLGPTKAYASASPEDAATARFVDDL